MKTITFYSYKGGAGRTVLMANVASYLARFGKKVFLMDFDLEAPGLHYKFELHCSIDINKGLVDYIHSFAVAGEQPSSLKDFVFEISAQDAASKAIHLMPAGNILTSQYWQQLSRINWHDLFYADDPKGIPFFLELKAQIEEEYNPDYLLIDSRTGITEVGGVATTVLADSVVCLLLKNRENLEGAREVLRSINRTLRYREQVRVTMFPVLSRVTQQVEDESEISNEVLNFLNQEASELADTLSFEKLHLLHIDSEIEVKESLLLDRTRLDQEIPLHADYVHLIRHLFKDDLDAFVQVDSAPDLHGAK